MDTNIRSQLDEINRGGTFFSRFAKRAAALSGRPLTFLTAVAVVAVWAATGPIFHYSDTWQLVINTGTTIITFLMVFLIQNTQNRDGLAMQLKLDELIRSVRGAHTAMMDLEELTDNELELIKRQYNELALRGREALRHGKTDTGSPAVKAEFRDPRVSKE